MGTRSDDIADLERRLQRMAAGADGPDPGPTPDDEPSWFELIDQSAATGKDPEALSRTGARYAEAFVNPYLHADELPGVLREVDGLLAVHHRGRLRIHEAGDDEALVAFERLAEDATNGNGATPFDTGVVQAAIGSRFPDARFDSEPDPEGDTSYTFWRIRTR